jgi:RNA polymerase sigma-70 factor, ECF subfamily
VNKPLLKNSINGLNRQAKRRNVDNLVYWPVITNKRSPASMNKMKPIDESEAQRWREHLRATGENNDKQAYQALYLHFAPKIKSFYIQHGMTANAEELTHEVFIRVWQKASSYSAEKANVSTWIYTIARNLKIDEFRKKRITEVNQEDYDEASMDDNQAEKIDLSRDKQNISSIMMLMKDEQRQVIQKVYFEDKSHSEVAGELGMTLGEVKSRVRSGLKILRTNLGGVKA